MQIQRGHLIWGGLFFCPWAMRSSPLCYLTLQKNDINLRNKQIVVYSPQSYAEKFLGLEKNRIPEKTYIF